MMKPDRFLLPRVMFAGAVLFTALGTVACGGDKSEPKKDDAKASKEDKAESNDDKKSEGEDAAKKDDDPKAKPASAKNDGATACKAPSLDVSDVEPGPVYLGVRDVGLVMIDGEGQVKLVQKLKYLAKRMHVAPNGTLWLSAIGGTYRVNNGQAKMVSRDAYDGIAALSDDEAYAVSFKGVYTYNGGTWKLEKKEDAFGAEISLLKDVAVDKEGNLHVASSRKLHMRKKGSEKWEEMKLDVNEPFVNEFVRDGAGTVHVSTNEGVLSFVGGQWKKMPCDFGIGGVDELAVSPAGSFAARDGLAKLFVLDASGLSELEAKAAGLKAAHLKRVAVDAQGRHWLGTDFGLAVLDAKGKKVQQWENGTLDGVTGTVEHIAVIGKGPNALPEATEQATGKVVGKVEKKGSGPLAEVAVEICPSPSSVLRAGETPCGDAPFKLSTKTDKDGKYAFEGVPVGSYSLAIKGGEKWTTTYGGDCCATMKKDGTYDNGTVKLK